MRKLVRRARSRSDRAWFLVVRKWPLVVSALGVLLGAVALLPSPVGVVLSLIGLGLGAITLTRDVRTLRRRWCGHEFAEAAAPFPGGEIEVPAAYPAAGYTHLPGRGTALLSDEIDRAVREREFRLRLAEHAYRLPPSLRATAPHVLPLRARGRSLFNGAVVGLRSDPLPGSGAAEINLHRTGFFDFQCSNELCGLRITDRETGHEFDPRRRLLTDASGRLRTLTASELADVVGISTLAFTTDGLLVVVGQSDRNSASPLLLAPSGSGSLEPRDLVATDGAPRRGLADALCTGMERELREETGLARGSVAGTELVGFARWMERGAKPEFFGVTRLSVSSSSIRSTGPRGAERLTSSEVSCVELDLATLRRELRSGTELVDAPSLPSRVRESGSLPLLLAIRAAALR